jgi:hypothetical protein
MVKQKALATLLQFFKLKNHPMHKTKQQLPNAIPSSHDSEPRFGGKYTYYRTLNCVQSYQSDIKNSLVGEKGVIKKFDKHRIYAHGAKTIWRNCGYFIQNDHIEHTL